MTIDEALRAVAVIESLYDGTEASKDKIVRLVNELIERPEMFWQRYLEIHNPPSQLAIALINSGAVDDQTTFADLKRIMEANSEQGEDAK